MLYYCHVVLCLVVLSKRRRADNTMAKRRRADNTMAKRRRADKAIAKEDNSTA
jgi:hypothetical protein